MMWEYVKRAPSNQAALVSCFVNGEPTAAICCINEEVGGVRITPMFVAVHGGNSCSSFVTATANL